MSELSKVLGTEVFTEHFANSPKLLAFVEANFGGAAHESVRRDLLNAADSSEFSLRQWVDSLRTLRAWLDARGLVMSVEDELGYVCCAGEAAGPGANLSYLPELVADMLNTFGCERAEPRNHGEFKAND